MVNVPFPPFEPDKHRFNMAASPSIINVVPKVDGWGPLKGETAVEPVYAYLTDQSGNHLLDEDGNAIMTGYIFGDQLIDEDGNILTDEDGNPILDSLTSIPFTGSIPLPGDCYGLFSARKADGTARIFACTQTLAYELSNQLFTWSDVSRTSGGAYTGTGRWSGKKFGSYLYLANGADAEQMIELEAGTNFAPNSSAPIAKYLEVVNNFLWRGNISGHPNRVQWSALDNPQSNEAGVNQSDYQDLPTGDEVMGIVPMSFGAFIFMRSSIHAANTALSSEYVFSFTEVDGMHGTSAPWAICQIGQDALIYYSDDGFWLYRGGWNPVGAGRVNLWFFRDCDQNERENIIAMADPENEVVWFAYTDTTGTRKLLGYDYVDDRWCLATPVIQASARIRTLPYTISGQPVLEEGLLRFAGINSSRRLVYLYGDNLAATLETNEASFGEYRSFVGGGFLLGDATSFTVIHKVAQYKGGTLTEKSAVSPGARSKLIPLKGDGSVHRFKLSIAAAATWTTANGLTLEIAESSEG